jgi:HK97 family phage portal protein
LRVFGLQITRAKAAPPTAQAVDSRGSGWWPLVREPYTGAWQKNVEVKLDTVLTYSAVYACVTRIASDIAKLRLRLVEQDGDGIWTEKEVAAFSPVLRKPNRYQTRIKFIEQWIVSKLLHGNTYVLKERDQRGVVVALYVLDPSRVTPLVALDGAVYYQLRKDHLAGLQAEEIAVPASEIIHDTMVSLYHPLVGVSPIHACGLAAVQGIRIQTNSAQFFGNGSNPGGILTAPGAISDETAQRLKAHWDANYSGANVGKVAVLGDGLKYEAMTVTAVDAQLIEQLKWSAETVCSTFHVPAYMVGVGNAPSYNNIEALNQQYYSQCLQVHIESIELLLDEGLGLNVKKDGARLYGTEFDLDDLLRMDTAAMVKTWGEAATSGLAKPNEGRRKLGLPPVEGGDTPYLQQQNYSLAALARRDADDPFTKPEPASGPAPEPANDDEALIAEGVRTALAEIRKGLAHV